MRRSDWLLLLVLGPAAAIEEKADNGSVRRLSAAASSFDISRGNGASFIISAAAAAAQSKSKGSMTIASLSLSLLLQRMITHTDDGGEKKKKKKKRMDIGVVVLLLPYVRYCNRCTLALVQRNSLTQIN